jgi:hypothetical protein
MLEGGVRMNDVQNLVLDGFKTALQQRLHVFKIILFGSRA